MTYGRPTTLQDVLAAIAVRAATAGTWIGTDFVWQSLDIGELQRTGFTADTVVVLGEFRGSFNQSDIAGGGNYVCTVEGTLDVSLYHRLSVDEVARDTTRIQSSTLGMVAKWHDLLRKLSQFSPEHTIAGLGSGECILEEPMRPLSFHTKPADKVNGWASMTTPFEVKFRLGLTGDLDFSDLDNSQYLVVI